jgi:hypothetical protein
MDTTDLSPAARPTSGRRLSVGDAVALGIEVFLVGAAVAVGAVLNHRGVPLHADAAPLFARWLPHVGPGTPVVLALAAVGVLRGPAWAARLPWRRLLGSAYLAALSWTFALALVDGWTRGITARLTPQAEYLHDVPMVGSVRAMLAGFSSHILDFRPGSWTTHVAGHPPGAFLVFVGLDRVGLGGGTAAALVCLAVGACAPVGVAVTLRALGHEPAARVALPFLVLFPGAVWVGVSADGLFAGVVAAGLALLAIGGLRAGVLGGLLLGYSLYLSYGLVLVGLLALGVLALRGGDRLRTAVAAAAGAGAVLTAFSLAGFSWPDGYHLVVQRYYQGWAAQRPYAYWVWADLACLVLCAGPATGPALWRAARTLLDRQRAAWSLLGRQRAGWSLLDRQRAGFAAAPVVLPLLALAAILAADLTGLSKAEVEWIWLPYAFWLPAATALLPPQRQRFWLAAQVTTALLVNHAVLTNW